MKRLMNYLKQRKEERLLKRMIKEADRLHKQNGKQYFVVPLVYKNVRTLTLMNNDLHNAYNKQAKKIGKPIIQYRELLTMAVYQTGISTLAKR
jgi:hypothetical protein